MESPKFSLNPDGAGNIIPSQQFKLNPNKFAQNSENYTEDLATKFGMSLGQDNPGEDILKESLRTGDTDRYSQLLAQRKQLEVQGMRNDIVQQIADSGNMTPFDSEIVRSIAETDLTSPNLNSILEEEYARKLTDLHTSLIEENDNTYSEAASTNLDATDAIINRADWQGARNLIATTILDSLKTKFDESGILGQGLAWAQQLIPFRQWASLATYNPSAPARAFFPGDDLEKMYSYIATLPPTEVKTQLQAYVDRELQTGNYLDAMNFVEGFLSYSDSDKFLTNAFGAMDAVGVVGDLGGAAILGKLAKSMRGASRAVTGPTKDVERLATLADLPTEANRASFTRALSQGVLPSKDIKAPADIERIFPSLMRPQEEFNGRSLRAGGPVLSRLEQAAIARAGTAMEIVTGINRVERLSPAMIEKGYEEAEQFLKDNFVNINQKIVNVIRTAAEDTPSNTYSVTIQIGKTDGSTFSNKLSAQKAAKTIGLRTNDGQIKQLPNGGWVVEVSRYVDESSKGLRGVEVETDFKLPDNWVTRFLSGAVGADNLLSKSQTQARGVAVQTSEQMGALLESFAEPVRRMSKAQRKEFDTFLIKDRDRVDPVHGRSMPPLTVQDFEDLFYQQFNKLPSYDQMDAYQSYKQLYEMDRLIRDYSVLKQKAINGIEKFSVRVKGEKGEPTDLQFEGKEVSEFPRGVLENYNIGVIDDEGNIVTGIKYSTRNMSATDWEKLKKLQLEGNYKIIQAFEGSQKINGKYYNFVMMNHFKRDRPSLGNLTYSGGTRQIHKSPWYIKQPKLRSQDGRAYYHGDVSIANMRSFEEAGEAQKVLDTAIRMIKDRTPGAVKYFRENVPFWDIKDFLRSVQKGDISLDAPMVVTKGGSRTIDSEQLASNLKSRGINEFIDNNRFDLSNQITGRFLGESDTVNMKTYGVERGTIFKLEGQNILSPLDTMRYSMSNMVDTHVIHDYRLKSARDFTNTFGDVLDGSIQDFDSNGLEFIFDPHYKKDADPNRVRSAEAIRKTILSLFNNKTIVERQVDMYKERIVRTVRKLVGDGTADWVQDVALPKATTADTAMRAFSMHTKMGFFNIKQLFLQSTTALNVLAISPVHGVKGAAISWPLILAMNTKRAFLGDIGRKLSKVTGWSGDDFEEMVKAFKKSGFYNVGGDVGYIDAMRPPSLTKGVFKKFILEPGLIPFKAGERIARTMAFSTAYAERKAILKGKALNRADEAWILQRAKDLTGNMTRDSNAAYQKGYGAVATQFFGFQMRLMEQMLGGGGKLTVGERARLFTMMSFVYGVPVATGMTLGVWPVREWLKDQLAKDGVSYDDTIAEPFIDGFASQFLEMATGMDLNVSEKYGPGGLTTFYDLMKKDADLSEALLGASGGIIGDTIKDNGGIIRMIWETIDLNDQTNFPVTLEDMTAPLRNISTANNVIKLWEAVNTGKWISQNETVLTTIDAQEATWSWITGLDPERVSDAFNQIEAINQIKDYQKAKMKEMVIDYRRALELMRNGFPDQAAVLFSRVKAEGNIAGLTPSQMITMYSRAIDGRPLDTVIEDQYNKYIGAK